MAPLAALTDWPTGPCTIFCKGGPSLSYFSLANFPRASQEYSRPEWKGRRGGSRTAPAMSAAMKKRRLGRTDLQVSEIGFGALEIGRPWGLPIAGDFQVPSERDVQKLLDHALELGINFIDTAPAYMLSEERIGKFLSHRRKDFYLASKCGENFDGSASEYDFSTAGTLRFIETSLRLLRTDYLDLVQIHCGPEEVETIRRGEPLEGMLRARKEGKVRWVGVSCETAGALAALETNSYDVLQLPYSLLNRAIEREILGRAAKKHVGIIIREALERGKLSDKIRKAPPEGDPAARKLQAFTAKMDSRGVRTSLSEIAIQFVLRDPAVGTVLLGTRSARHLEEAVEAAGRPLNPSLVAEINALE